MKFRMDVYVTVIVLVVAVVISAGLLNFVNQAEELSVAALLIGFIRLAFLQKANIESLENYNARLRNLEMLLRQVKSVSDGVSTPGESNTRFDSSPNRTLDASEGSLRELAAEIGLIGGIVRELAAVVASQENEIKELKRVSNKVTMTNSTFSAAMIDEIEKIPALIESPVSEGRHALDINAAFLDKTLWTQGLADESIISAWENGSLEFWLQPICSLPQRKVLGYEVHPQLLVGQSHIAAATLGEVVKRQKLDQQLDQQIYVKIDSLARYLKSRGSQSFICFASYSAQSANVWSTGRDTNLPLFGYENSSSVLMIVRGNDLEKEVALFRKLSENRTGLHISVEFDDVTDVAFTRLTQLGVCQVRMPLALFMDHRSSGCVLSERLGVLAADALRNGVQFVITGVDEDRQVAEVIDMGVTMAQGTAFGIAKPIRSDLFSEMEPREYNVVAGGSTDISDVSTETKRSFRDFLRRAV